MDNYLYVIKQIYEINNSNFKIKKLQTNYNENKKTLYKNKFTIPGH